MAARTVLRWFLQEPDPPLVQRVVVETEEHLALRNQERLEQAKRILGGRYVLHPSNAVPKQARPRTLAPRARAPDRVIPGPAPESLEVGHSP
jgi:hypothetical protein